MKAITICQPYAHLIVIGEKRVENRKWYTGHRGPLLIHAGKSHNWLRIGDKGRYPEMAFGAIVGQCVVKGCAHIDAITDAHRDQWSWLEGHEHTEGPWCWILGNVKRFATPIPYKGQLRVFDIPGLWSFECDKCGYAGTSSEEPFNPCGDESDDRGYCVGTLTKTFVPDQPVPEVAR